MNSATIALYLLAGLVGGAVNAAAGGAKLFVFPMLLAAGLPPVAANATATLSVWPAQFPAAWVYRDRLRDARDLLREAVPALAGALVGVGALLSIGDAGFLALVPAFLLTAATAIAFGEPLARRAARARLEGGARAWLAPALMALCGFYGGFFGAGMGFMLLATLTLAGHADVHDANGRKNLHAAAINSTAVLPLALSGLVDWRAAGLVALGGLGGGWLGARLARRVPPRFMRWGVAVFGVAMTAAFLAR